VAPRLRHRLGVALYLTLLGAGLAYYFGSVWSGSVLGLIAVPVLLAAALFIAFKMIPKLPTLVELVNYLMDEGLWYLVPEVIVLVTVGMLLAIAAAYPIVSPLIYTLF
jgi:hypothetical protein